MEKAFDIRSTVVRLLATLQLAVCRSHGTQVLQPLGCSHVLVLSHAIFPLYGTQLEHLLQKVLCVPVQAHVSNEEAAGHLCKSAF